MKYLHDNGFRVLTLTQLRYDPMNNVLYIKSLTTSSFATPTTNTGTTTIDSFNSVSNRK
jgi:hypothetical protein